MSDSSRQSKLLIYYSAASFISFCHIPLNDKFGSVGFREAGGGQPVKVSLEEIRALSAFSAAVPPAGSAAPLLSDSHASWFKLQIAF